VSLRVVADRDVRDPFRSMSALLLFGAFALVFAAIGYLGQDLQSTFGLAVVGTMNTLVPLASFGLSYGVVAGKRDRGALRVILAYPHSRRDVVLGSALGRAVLVVAAVTVGFVAGAVVFVAASGTLPDVGTYVAGWVLSCLFGVVIAAVGVGISASTRTSNRAIGGCVVAYILFFVAWGQLPTLVRFFVYGFHVPNGPPPTWQKVFVHLDPQSAFGTLVTALLGNGVASSGPVYTGTGFAALVLLGWIVLPLALADYRFDRTGL